MLELRLCPECKCEPRVVDTDGRGGYPLWGVYCPCQVKGDPFMNDSVQLYGLRELAVNNWNQRAEIISLKERIEELEELVEGFAKTRNNLTSAERIVADLAGIDPFSDGENWHTNCPICDHYIDWEHTGDCAYVRAVEYMAGLEIKEVMDGV